MSDKKTTLKTVKEETIIDVPQNIKDLLRVKVQLLAELEAKHKLVNNELVELAKTFLMTREIEFISGFEFDKDLNIKIK